MRQFGGAMKCIRVQSYIVSLEGLCCLQPELGLR